MKYVSAPGVGQLDLTERSCIAVGPWGSCLGWDPGGFGCLSMDQASLYLYHLGPSKLT